MWLKKPSTRDVLRRCVRACLDLGSVSLEEGAEWAVRALESRGYRVRYVKRYGRMVSVGLGVLKKVYIVRHESINKTVVCGARDAIEALREQGAVIEYRPDQPPKDGRAEALIEAQILERKMKSARNDLIISVAVGAVLVAVLAAAGAHPLAYALIPVVLLIIDSIPRPVLFTGHTEYYVPILYPIYRRGLGGLKKELPSESGENGSRPSD